MIASLAMGMCGPFLLAFLLQAQSPSSEALMAKAEEAVSKGDYVQALLLLEQARELDPNPRYIANQGIVYEKAALYPQAIDAFQRYLATRPPEGGRRAAELALARLRPAAIIESWPSGAAVILDGTRLGQTPLRTQLVCGAHLLELRLDGHQLATKSIEVKPGEPILVRQSLIAEAPEAATTAQSEEPNESAFDARPWAWGALAVGVAGIVTAAIFADNVDGLLDARDSANSTRAYNDADDKAHEAASYYYLGGSVGLVGLGVGTYLLLAF